MADEDAAHLAAALQLSGLWPGLAGAGLGALSPQTYAELPSGGRNKRGAEFDNPDAEEVEGEPGPEGPEGPEGPGAEGEADCDGQPPTTGLRRWVIRIRNVMFGRRDLEGSEGSKGKRSDCDMYTLCAVK